KRLASVDEPFKGARHFRDEVRETPRDVGWRRTGGIGSAPDHDTSGLIEFRRTHPWCSLRRPSQEQMRTGRTQTDQRRKLGIAPPRRQGLAGSRLEIVVEEISNLC